ncbi:MAG: hypothetical protein MUF42_15845 [Cytophagaceae bacterium]|jgi:hypothetical protein|nr:hypothetical protein [Cytophagaceae bacterium]
MEWIIFIFVVILSFLLMGYYSHRADQEKRKKFLQKYQNEELVKRLMNNEFWQGQSKQELEDSLGKPENISTQVLKSKTKEIWKYNEKKKNQYTLKITLENDIVVGWDKK